MQANVFPPNDVVQGVKNNVNEGRSGEIWDLGCGQHVKSRNAADSGETPHTHTESLEAPRRFIESLDKAALRCVAAQESDCFRFLVKQVNLEMLKSAFCICVNASALIRHVAYLVASFQACADTCRKGELLHWKHADEIKLPDDANLSCAPSCRTVNASCA